VADWDYQILFDMKISNKNTVFGDGHAAEKIVEYIWDYLNKSGGENNGF